MQTALQLQYRRPLTHGLQALASYTWAHSLDNASNDTFYGLSNTVISAKNDYASSDFVVRQSFSGALTYQLPGATCNGPIAAITRDWSIDAVMVLRSSFPFNISQQVVSPGATGIALVRPDLVPGVPIWMANLAAAGGKSLDRAAFTFPSPFRQGHESRNDLRGFGLAQVDLSLMRRFPLTARTNVKLQSTRSTRSTIRPS